MAQFVDRRPVVLRQFCVAASLIGFLAATTGGPVVLRVSSKKDRSQPYPCMDHSCGCTSAEACWRGCCCFTMAQKLAWAEERDVTPPAFVVAAAKREARLASCVQTSCVQTSCVQTSCVQTKSSCCAKHDHDLDEHDDGPLEPAPHVDSADSNFQIVFVLADASRKCQGQTQLWLLLGAATLTQPVEFSTDLLPRGKVALFSPKLASLSLRPAVPPPRSS